MPLSSWVEVDLARFARNLRVLGRLAAPAPEILLVAKADAYGHGAIPIALAAEEEGVSRIGVATLHEGIQLREAGISAEVVVLSPMLRAECDDAVRYQLEPTVSDLGVAREFSRTATQQGRIVRVHVEVDTGMGRVGLAEGDIEAFLLQLGQLSHVRIGSLYTHFPDADGSDLTFSHRQVRRFRGLVERLRLLGACPPRVHMANSAGFLNIPDARLDWARLGLACYGIHPNRDDSGVVLEPVMSLRSRLVQIREVPAGSTISYACTCRTTRRTRVGLVPVGYGHGYSWLLSSRGSMLVAGRHAPILGRVTMDLTMIDLTDHPPTHVGDEAVLFGDQAGASLAVEEVARGSETLPYEVLCTIGKRVTRLYRRGGDVVRLSTLVGDRPDWQAKASEYLRQRDPYQGVV